MDKRDDVDVILETLRTAIRQKGFTQLEVQAALGWGRSYISQLLIRQKQLRVDQLLKILAVIEVEPLAFWREVYAPLGPESPPSSLAHGLGEWG